MLEQVTHKFLRFLAFKNKMPFHRFNHEYTPLHKEFRLNTIADQPMYNDILAFSTLIKLMNVVKYIGDRL